MAKLTLSYLDPEGWERELEINVVDCLTIHVTDSDTWENKNVYFYTEVQIDDDPKPKRKQFNTIPMKVVEEYQQ